MGKYPQCNTELKEQEWNYGPKEKLTINIYWTILFTDWLINHGKITKITKTFRVFISKCC